MSTLVVLSRRCFPRGRHVAADALNSTCAIIYIRHYFMRECNCRTRINFNGETWPVIILWSQNVLVFSTIRPLHDIYMYHFFSFKSVSYCTHTVIKKKKKKKECIHTVDLVCIYIWLWLCHTLRFKLLHGWYAIVTVWVSDDVYIICLIRRL